MAPEQVRGERADHRSDIFSTGVVLYEVFGGRRAFEGDSFGATLYKILEEVPTPLRELDATLPPEIDAVVERALVKPREERYSHMSDMLRDLQAYRQQLIVTNSPPFGGTSTDVVRIPSNAPRPSVTPSPGSGSRGGVPQSASDAPTIAATPTPFPPAPSGSTPLPALDSTPGAPAPGNRGVLPALLAAAVIVVGGIGYWSMNRGAAPSAAPPAATEPTAANQQEIASQLEQASRALQAGDRAAAQRHADAVLAMSPGHVEARRLRDQAQQAIDAANRGVANARELLDAGRFDEASRAAGEVLAIDPTNADARRVMDDAGRRSKGKGADDARARMTSARNGAIAASAQKLASAAFNVAVAADREAASLLKRGRLADATAKYYEASGLYRSAEVAAQTEAAARVARAQAQQKQAEEKQAEQKQPETRGSQPPVPAAESKPTTPPPTLPPVPTSTGLPSAPVAAPVAPPSAPTAPKPAPPESTPPPVSPSAGIPELLERYESALETRNLDAMKRIWPTLSSTQENAFRRDFQNARRIEVDIVSPQISVNGNTATAQFTRRYRLETTDGQRVGSESRTTMTLQRVGQTWTITQIQFVLLK
jgi:tetratricopeptide (TPR) repeat protein